MKKYLPIILLLLIALILPSCAGIGDGAMFDDITTGEQDTVDYFYVVGNAPYVETGREAVFKMYSPGGELQADLSFGYTVAKEFYRILFFSERDSQKNIVNPDKNQEYLDVNLYLGSSEELEPQGGFRIYASDYVEITEEGPDTMGSSRTLEGYVEGIYQEVLSHASASIKPDKGTIISVAQSKGHDLSVEISAEIYKLLMTEERQAYDEELKVSAANETLYAFFKTEYGKAVFYVNKDDAVGYYEGFLDGEHAIYFKIEGIHKKLMDYIK
jgi:hypothetical protein